MACSVVAANAWRVVDSSGVHPIYSSSLPFTPSWPLQSGSSFSTNHPLLNRVHHLTRQASISNLMDVPTDCPQVLERRAAASEELHVPPALLFLVVKSLLAV
jgi:hypothetical protein